MLSSKQFRNICLFLIFFFAPAFAFAQEVSVSASIDYRVESVEATIVEADTLVAAPRTAHDNFGGFQIGATLLAGVGRCDDKIICNEDERDWNKYTIDSLANLQLELAYLWGEDVLFGVSLNTYYIFPLLLGADVRFKMVFALTPNDGITMSSGVGVGAHGNYDLVCYRGNCDVGETEYGVPHYLYMPMQIGYDHVFDNGFLLGVSLETHMAFNNVTKCGERRVMPALGFAGGGIHLGYIF